MRELRTPVPYTHIAHALERCREFLWDGRSYFDTRKLSENICGALHNSRELDNAATAAQEIISKRLDGFVYFDSWLIGQGIPYEQVNKPRLMQAHRHAWVKKMIREFSKMKNMDYML